MSNDAILRDVGNYYTGKIEEHGATSKGVDWNSEDSQRLRFINLLKVTEGLSKYSLLDLGCGYGALLEMLAADERLDAYLGFDISEAMLSKARELYGSDQRVRFCQELNESDNCDVVLASGIFNVKLGHSEKDWKNYVYEQLNFMRTHASKGIAFNMLTSYSDKEYMREDLFYADPCEIFDYCKRNYSRHVALLHDYGLYEFTILVRFY